MTPPALSSREWLEKLVAFDTTSRYSNLALIDEVAAYFQALGLPHWRSGNPEGNKANLFATLPASDGNTQGGIILSGHTDVVPVDGQAWASNPFQLSERNGRLYGRGSCDMKGFIASALALLPDYLAQQRAQPLHFALSYDEEVGCLGAPLMIKDMQKRGQKADSCIVGEPTMMRVVVAHKGINLLRCTVHGKAAHSSLTPQGCNAIEYAARLICRIRDIADNYRANGPFDHDYDVPYTSMTTNLIQGGIAVNTIPAQCSFQYEFRNLPGMPVRSIQAQVEAYIADELLPKMRQEQAEADIELETLAYAPALEASEQAAITELARALSAQAQVEKVAYGTEAGLFSEIGIPTIVCGPGDIQQAHKADEYIEISQLNACDAFLHRLIRAAP